MSKQRYFKIMPRNSMPVTFFLLSPIRFDSILSTFFWACRHDDRGAEALYEDCVAQVNAYVLWAGARVKSDFLHSDLSKDYRQKPLWLCSSLSLRKALEGLAGLGTSDEHSHSKGIFRLFEHSYRTIVVLGCPNNWVLTFIGWLWRT